MNVMIVDDHFVVRSGLVASLELEDDITVVAEAERGEEAPALLVSAKPEVILVDLQLPGWNGIETTERLLELDPAARVLVFSTFARDDEIQSSLDAGALGFLQKTASRDDLIAALRRVAAGERSLAPEIATRLAGLKLGPALTLREREILSFIA